MMEFCLFLRCVFFCCFKQETAYELRISDWSSDGALPICSCSRRSPSTWRRCGESRCRGMPMSPGEVAAILFGSFAVLIVLRVPVAFALGLACVPVRSDARRVGHAWDSRCRSRWAPYHSTKHTI